MTLGKAKLTLFVFFNGFWQFTVVLLSLGKTLQKNSTIMHEIWQKSFLIEIKNQWKNQ